MAEITGVIAGKNKVKDYQFRTILSDIVNEGVIEGLEVTAGQVAVGKAAIKVTRTNGQTFLVDFHNTTTKTVTLGNNKKVFIAIDQNKIDDGDTYNTNTDGTGIGAITVADAYPSTGAYIKLAETDGVGAITDMRTFISYVGLDIIGNVNMDGVFNGDKSSDIASAATTDLSTATGNTVHITGTTTITGFGTVQAGATFKLIFDGILTLTYNGTSLILPTGTDITTIAGDSCIIVSEGSGNWRVISYQRADGSGLVSSAAGNTVGTGIFGETISVGDALCIVASDGKLYKLDTSDVNKLNFVGFSLTNGILNDTGTYSDAGVDINQSGLTTGSEYFGTDTAGVISTTPGTYTISVGLAISATEILIKNNKSIGLYTTKSFGTNYLADTDGFAIGTRYGAQYSNSVTIQIKGYVGATSPATFNLNNGGEDYSNGQELKGGMMMPVKKGQYWRVDYSESNAYPYQRLVWVPLS